MVTKNNQLEIRQRMYDKARKRVDIRVDPRSYPRLSASTNKGFTLLEVIIAITILTVGITASAVLVTKTVSQMNLAPSRLIAAYLTQEGIEIVRNIRDTNWLEGDDWDNGLTGCSAGCEADYTNTAEPDPNLPLYNGGRFLHIDDADDFYKYTSDPNDIETKFKRKITIESLASPDRLEVTVETTWTEKGQPQSRTAMEILYDWK